MLRVREIHRDTVQTISVVETVETGQICTGTYCHAWGKIEALGVIVRRVDSEYAVDINAKPTDVENLLRKQDSQRVGAETSGRE